MAAVQLHTFSFVFADRYKVVVVVVFVITATWVGIIKITKGFVMYQFADQDLL